MPMLRLAAKAYRDFVLALPEQQISGGAAYDALVAATAAANRAQLLSCDPRAAALYERYGIKARLL